MDAAGSTTVTARSTTLGAELERLGLTVEVDREQDGRVLIRGTTLCLVGDEHAITTTLARLAAETPVADVWMAIWDAVDPRPPTTTSAPAPP
jgi:hypothetical protein